MAIYGVEVRVGQVWRSSGGAKWHIFGYLAGLKACWQAVNRTTNQTHCFGDDGRYWPETHESQDDLIELVTDAPVVQPPIPTPEVVSETPLERRAQQSALDVQVGGDHYKTLVIQPVEYCHRNGLGFCESSVIKYVTRWKAKNGIKDLEKARHFIDLLIEMERGAK